jgi:hypothetical protein
MPFFIIFFGVILALIAPYGLRARRTRSNAPLKEASWAMLAGVVAGLVWGVGARLAMRIVAIAEGDATEFSIGGTILILLTGAILGLPLGLIFAIVRRWLPGSGIGKGLSFGLILALLLLVPFAALGASDLGSGPTAAPVLIGVGLFSGLFVLHGAVMESIIHRRRPSAAGRETSTPRPPTAGEVAELARSQS